MAKPTDPASFSLIQTGKEKTLRCGLKEYEVQLSDGTKEWISVKLTTLEEYEQLKKETQR